ncbi:MAG: gliding motility-associated C-terminal domain-containing protein, partial [Bacteroidota bacterium]
LTWFFGDGNSFIGDTATHQYAQEGTYLVTLELTNRCGLDSVLTDTVIVYQEIPEPTIPNSTSLCTDPITLNAADGSNGAPDPSWNYAWSTGETTQTISISDLAGQALLVSVVISDSIGCTNTDSTLVVDGRPIFDLGTDQTVCQGTPVDDLNASNNGALFTWTLNGVNTGNTSRLQSVNTNVIDTLVYTLTVNDTITGCSDADTISFLVNPSPEISTSTTETTACGLSNGSATVTVVSPATFDVVWTGNNGFMGTDAATGNVLDAGVYQVTVTDAVSGCPTSETVSVTDGGDDFAITNVIPDSSCTLASVQLFLNDSISSGSNVAVILQNQTTGNLISVDERVLDITPGTRGFTVDGLEPGDYFVQIANASICVQDTIFTIPELPQVTIASPTFLDACGATTEVSVDVSGLSNPEVLWTAFNGGGFPVTADITQPTVTVDAAGLYLVTVSDESSGLCPATDSVTVNLNSFPGVTINTIGENCEGQLTLALTTAPDGDYSTVWTQNGSQIGIGSSIVVTESGRYDVLATLQSTGCQATDFAAITINDPLEVQAIGEPACDDGNPVMLTAIATGTGSDSLLYTWRGPGQISATLNENTIDVFEPGTYTVTVRRNLTPTDGCTATDRIAIERIAFDSVVATELAVVCPPDPDPSINTAVLEATGDFLTFTWTRPDSVIRTGAMLSTGIPGLYQVIAQDAFGCRDTAFSTVREFCEVFVRAPTAFRPRSTVGNDAYRVVYKNIEEGSFSAQIFNRWGDLIREFQNPAFEWDGTTANGGVAPPGTYVVVFRYRNQFSDEMEEFVERTRVTLIR